MTLHQSRQLETYMENNDRTVVFINWSGHEFTGYWNSIPYKFQAGEKKYMEEWRARHFAKHLANRELLRDGHENDTSPKLKDGKYDNERFNEYLNKAIIDVEVQPSEPADVGLDVLNRNLPELNEDPVEEVVVLKKSGRPKKAKPSTPSDEDAFEGINNGR